MLKFNFLRTCSPKEASWDGGNCEWQPPQDYLGRFTHEETWSYAWNWLRGIRKTGFNPATDIDHHISKLNGANQQERLAAIYTLGGMGEPVLEPLLVSLMDVAGRNRIEPARYRRLANGSFEVQVDPRARRWNDGGHIVQDEAYALSCLGEIAIDPLMQLLMHKDPWIAVNAVFALGEIGRPAGRAVPNMAKALDTGDDRIIRAVLEAIGCVGTNVIATLPAITKLLRMSRNSWRDDAQLQDAVVGDKIHNHAMTALLRSDLNINDVEDLLIEVLERPTSNGHLPAVALEMLTLRGSPEGLRRAVHYLQAHRWDDTRWPDEGAAT